MMDLILIVSFEQKKEKKENIWINHQYPDAVLGVFIGGKSSILFPKIPRKLRRIKRPEIEFERATNAI